MSPETAPSLPEHSERHSREISTDVNHVVDAESSLSPARLDFENDMPTPGPHVPVDAAAQFTQEYSSEQRALFSRMAGVCEKDRFADVPPFRALYPPEELDTDFKRKYPPDAFGEEMAPNARVWKVFRDEATAQDEFMLDGWNKTLDILLIFAGLFSAVSTAFIIEAYTFLQPDYQEYTAHALFVLLATRNGSDVPVAPLPPLADPSAFSPSVHARWINGLWLASLFLSLAVSLLSILVKQWLHQYSSRLKASCESLRGWAHLRSLYFRGMTRWHLSAFIATLPLLLHLALFLFLTGLLVLLWDLDYAIALALLFLTATLCTFYVVCFILPAWQVDCPTSTPLLEQLLRVWDGMFRLARRGLGVVLLPPRFYRIYHDRQQWGFLERIAEHVPSFARTIAAICRNRFRQSRLLRKFRSYLERRRLPYNPSRESRAMISLGADILDASALQWMLRHCSTPEVILAGVEAIGALQPSCPAVTVLKRDKSVYGSMIVYAATKYFNTPPRDSEEAARHAPEVARFLRAFLCLTEYTLYMTNTHLAAWIRGIENYDLPVFSAIVSNDGSIIGSAKLDLKARLQRWTHVERQRSTGRPFTNSTGVLVLVHCKLDLQDSINIISALDISQLTRHDADPIGKAIAARLGQLDHSCASHSCGPHCVVELLCKIALDHATSDTESILPVIQRMVSLCSSKACDLDMPNLLRFVSSRHMLQIPWSSQDLRGLAHMVSSAVRPGEAVHSHPQASRLMHVLLSVWTLACNLSTDEPTETFNSYSATVLCAGAICKAFSPASEAPFSVDEVPHPLPPWPIYAPDGAGIEDPATYSFTGPLRLLRRNNNQPSPWHFFGNVRAPIHSASLVHLAYILSCQLCMLSTQNSPWVTPLSAEFFGSSWAWKVVEVIARDGEGQHTFERVVWHCILLKPDWWSSLLSFENRSMEVGGLRNRMYDIVRAINAKVARGRLGRCAVCTTQRHVQV